MISHSGMVFVRPNNMMLTHPLQVLSMAVKLSKWSGYKLTRFRVPREPDQQRLLNFASFTFQDSDAAQDVIIKSSTKRIPLNRRAAKNYETLAFAEKLENRDIGLVEIASMVGLPLDAIHKRVTKNRVNDTESEIQTNDQDDVSSQMKYILAPLSGQINKTAFHMMVKCERRQTSKENLKLGSRAPYSKSGLGQDGIEEQNYDQMSPLQQRWKAFGGFANRNERIEKEEKEEDSGSEQNTEESKEV